MKNLELVKMIFEGILGLVSLPIFMAIELLHMQNVQRNPMDHFQPYADNKQIYHEHMQQAKIEKQIMLPSPTATMEDL